MTPVPGRRPIINFGGPRGPRPITPLAPSGPSGPRRPFQPGPIPQGPKGMIPRPGQLPRPGLNPLFGPKKKGGLIKTKSFPDLTGDGKVTMKDILKGKGVIKKKGGMIKKAEGGLIKAHKLMAMSTKKFT